MRSTISKSLTHKVTREVFSMDEVTQLKLRIMALEASQRKSNNLLRELCKVCVDRGSFLDESLLKAMTEYLKNL